MAIRGNDGNLYNSQIDADALNPSGRVNESEYYGGGDLGLAKEIMNAPANAIKNWADRNAAASANAEIEKARAKEAAKNTGIMVDFYCAGNWDGVLSAPTFNNKGFTLKAIAHAKKGDCESAFSLYLVYIDRDYEGDNRSEQYLSEKTKKFFAETKLSSLAEEAIKQAYSKAKGHQVTDEEFKQFQISLFEKKITNLYAELKTGKVPVQNLFRFYTKYQFNGKVFVLNGNFSDDNMAYWLRKWSNLQGLKEYTGEDLKKIPGINEKMIKDLLYLQEVGDYATGKKKPGKVFKIVMVGLLIAGVVGYIISILPDILALFK
jgi:hypothetical protein